MYGGLALNGDWKPKLGLDLQGGTRITLDGLDGDRRGDHRRRSSTRPPASSTAASTPPASRSPRSPPRATTTSSSRSRAANATSLVDTVKQHRAAAVPARRAASAGTAQPPSPSPSPQPPPAPSTRPAASGDAKGDQADGQAADRRVARRAGRCRAGCSMADRAARHPGRRQPTTSGGGRPVRPADRASRSAGTDGPDRRVVGRGDARLDAQPRRRVAGEVRAVHLRPGRRRSVDDPDQAAAGLRRRGREVPALARRSSRAPSSTTPATASRRTTCSTSSTSTSTARRPRSSPTSPARIDRHQRAVRDRPRRDGALGPGRQLADHRRQRRRSAATSPPSPRSRWPTASSTARCR